MAAETKTAGKTVIAGQNPTVSTSDGRNALPKNRKVSADSVRMVIYSARPYRGVDCFKRK